MRIYRPVIIKLVNYSAISYEISGRQWVKEAHSNSLNVIESADKHGIPMSLTDM